MEDNNHILSPLKPLYSNISTFISSLVGSFHSFNRNADHITFRWLLSRNALLERSLYYSPLLATPSCIKTASNFLSCLFFFWSNFFYAFYQPRDDYFSVWNMWDNSSEVIFKKYSQGKMYFFTLKIFFQNNFFWVAISALSFYNLCWKMILLVFGFIKVKTDYLKI